MPDRRLIVHDEDRLAVAARKIRLRPLRLGGGDSEDRGDEHREARASIPEARDVQRAFVALHDGERRGQAEPGAAADLLGGEERIEDVIDHIRFHAVTTVFDIEPDMRTAVDVDVAGAKEEHAAVRHGIARIDAEIHEHLVQLGRVSEDRPRLPLALAADLNVLWKGIADDPLDIGDEGAWIEPVALGLHAAGERQDMPHHLGTATRAGRYRFEQVLVLLRR